MSLHSRAFCPRPFRSTLLSVASASILLAVGCTEEAFLNATRPLSDGILVNADDARDLAKRGKIGVGFINNTSYRVLCTFGGYDPQDADTAATIGQLGVTTQLDLPPTFFTPVLQMPCTREFSVGGRRLLQLVLENDLDSTRTTLVQFLDYTVTDMDPNRNLYRFVPSRDLIKLGAGFTSAPFGDPQGMIPTQGTAEPVTKLLGVDYQCDSVLLFTFDENPNYAGGFVTKLETSDDHGIDVNRLLLLTPAERAVDLATVQSLEPGAYFSFVALGAPTSTAMPPTVTPGTDPARPNITVTNPANVSLSAAFFDPEGRLQEVVTVSSGTQQQLTVPPGLYNVLFALDAFNWPPWLTLREFKAGLDYRYEIVP